ncbi:type III pantothenate kinase [Anaplasmataceae bacterium AB001_6]|nr:type III pantothenate kinase [Anaplasmataceae bacterium AB001_6]
MQKKKFLAAIDIGNSNTKCAFFENEKTFYGRGQGMPELYVTKEPIGILGSDSAAISIIAETIGFLIRNKKIVPPHKDATIEEIMDFIAADLPWRAIGLPTNIPALNDFGYYIKDSAFKKETNSFRPHISEQLINLGKKGMIEDIFISSVVPYLNISFEKEIFNLVGIKPTFISSCMAGIKSNYSKQLGADRVANIKAANFLYPNEDIIIIDMGTATTIDIINTDNIFLGGMILPGPNLFRNSLSENTEVESYISEDNEEVISSREPEPGEVILKSISVNERKIDFSSTSLIGTDTSNAISNGIKYGYIAMIEELISKIFQEQKKDFKIIITGGHYNLTEELNLPTEPIADVNLTLMGIMCVYKYTKMRKHCHSPSK